MMMMSFKAAKVATDTATATAAATAAVDAGNLSHVQICLPENDLSEEKRSKNDAGHLL